MAEAQNSVAEAVWNSLSQKAWEDWSVWNAANDSGVLATIEVLDGQPETESVRSTRGALKFYIWKEYPDVPFDRLEDVPIAAKSIIREEKIVNGEA